MSISMQMQKKRMQKKAISASLPLTKTLAQALKKSIGKRNAMDKNEVLETVYPDKTRMIYDENREWVEELEIKEMWRKCKGIMCNLRKHLDTFVVSSSTGNGEFVYHIVSSKAEAKEFSERLEKIIKGMNTSKERCLKAVKNNKK